MPRKIVSKTSFLGGEAGQLLEGRSDLAQHQLGAQKLENFVALKGGGVTRRPGTRYVKNTLNDKPARLFPFVVSYDSSDDMYVAEISLASATTIAFRVIRVSDNAVYTPTSVNLTLPYTVASTINLNEIQVSQSAEVLFIVHKSFPPLILYRNATAPTFLIEQYQTGTLSNVNLLPQFRVPYRDPNVSGITLAINTASAGTGRTVTASAAFFNASHVGAYFLVDQDVDATYEGAFLVTAFTSSTSVTVTVITALAGTGATTAWRESAWSAYRGWPRTATFYDQRLVFGGNTTQPDTFWLSEVSDYFQMSKLTSGISDPLSFTLASDKLNQIRWMVGGKKLTIGTSSSELVGSVTNDGTNLRVQFDEETNHGSAPVKPTKSAYSIPFVQRSGQTVREMVFNFDSDSYIATDLNIFASHIATQYGDFTELSEQEGINGVGNISIVQMAYQESPFNVLWILDSLGRVYGLTRDKQQQIAAWHSHVLGGEISNADHATLGLANLPTTQPQVLSICVMPNPDGKRDRLWLVVGRTINSTLQIHVEFVDDVKANFFVNAGSYPDTHAFLDCMSHVRQIGGSGYTSWTAPTRFFSSNAYIVAINDAGHVVHCGVVAVGAAGEFTTNSLARFVAIGLHANAELRLLPFEGGTYPELYMRSKKRADTAAIRMYQTYGLKVGKNRIDRPTGWEENTTFENILFPLVTESNGDTATFTGVKEVSLPTEHDNDGSFALAMEEPWSCTILSICSRVVSNEI